MLIATQHSHASAQLRQLLQKTSPRSARSPPATTGTRQGGPRAPSCCPPWAQETVRATSFAARLPHPGHTVWGPGTEALGGMARPSPRASSRPWRRGPSPRAPAGSRGCPGATSGAQDAQAGSVAPVPQGPGRANSTCHSGMAAGSPPAEEPCHSKPTGAPHHLSCVHSGPKGWGSGAGCQESPRRMVGAVALHLQLGSGPEQEQQGCGRAPARRVLHTCSWHRAAIYNQPAV